MGAFGQLGHGAVDAVAVEENLRAGPVDVEVDPVGEREQHYDDARGGYGEHSEADGK